MPGKGGAGGAGSGSTAPDRGFRIDNLTLDAATVLRRNADIEHERKVAIFDLLEDNSFQPIGSDGGPYHLRLGIEDGRPVFDIRVEN